MRFPPLFQFVRRHGVESKIQLEADVFVCSMYGVDQMRGTADTCMEEHQARKEDG